MSIKYQILCSRKTLQKGVVVITHVGGRNPLGEVWSLKVEQVIEGIQSGNWEFFMNFERNSYQIEVRHSENRIEITTRETSRNLILELPDCPQYV